MIAAKKNKVITNGDTTFYQFDSKLGFWGVPNLEREVCFQQRPNFPVLVKHNSDGNRDNEVILSQGEKTIVCFGGSHTWGGGVEQDYRYTNYLANFTGENVINMGHCSLGLDQVCLAILQKSAKYNPKIIVIEQYPWAVHRVLNNYVNGYVRPHFSLDLKGNFKLNKISSLTGFRFFRKIIGSYFAFKKEFNEYKSGIDLNNNYDPLTDPIFLLWKARHYDYMYCLLDKILIVIKDHCQKNNIKLLFGLGTIQQQFGPVSKSELVNYELPRERFKELLNKNKIAFVDTTDTMLKEHSSNDPVIFNDGHINSKGHRVFADVIHHELLKLNWVTK
jgi:hypothetical protein